MRKVLVINGPNMNMLGIREPEIYGKTTYSQLVDMIKIWASELGFEAEVFQSNHEGDIVDRIQQAYGFFDALVLNPAAYTHTSVAIPDAIRAVGLPAVEVHISDVDSREDFRRISYIAPVCIVSIKGHGIDGYREALEILKKRIIKDGLQIC
ncbi:MAG: type II 3-dehydroquinate dehydratase [Spirochaetia bacterium]|nr:type II 3-dehydroquinate dehydratase [Spirochaetia bacterium]